MKTVRRPPYPKWNPGYFPCSSLTPPSAFLTPSIGVLRWIRVKGERTEHGCSWHVSSSGSDDYVIINREIATDHTTCESLFEEGILIE